MKKYILFILLTLIIKAESYGQFYKNLSIRLSTEVGYDMQTRSNTYNLCGPLILPSRLGSSILHIDKPTRYGIELLYKQNDNLEYYLAVGQTNRALRYWSIDSIGTDNTFANKDINLSIMD